MTKKVYTLILVFILTAFSSYAQKVLFTNTEQILNNLPEYENAKKQMDIYSEQVQKDIAKRNNEINQLKETLQKEQILLSEKILSERKEEIAKKTLDLQKYQNEVFGNQGFYFQKRHILIKPIQDKVYNTVSEIAREKGADLVIDKSSNNNQTIIYSNPDHDITQDVINRLNLKIY